MVLPAGCSGEVATALGGERLPTMSDEPVPQTLTLDQAFRAAFLMVDQYIALEQQPDEGLVLIHQYLLSDPARWEDWKSAVRRVLVGDLRTDPLSENLHRE